MGAPATRWGKLSFLAACKRDAPCKTARGSAMLLLNQEQGQHNLSRHLYTLNAPATSYRPSPWTLGRGQLWRSTQPWLV